MPFEIAEFPIKPMTEARKMCLRLAGLIREGCKDVAEGGDFQTCAVGAAYYACTKTRTPTSYFDFEALIAQRTGIPFGLIRRVSNEHCMRFVEPNWKLRMDKTEDLRLTIAAELEAGFFDSYAE